MGMDTVRRHVAYNALDIYTTAGENMDVASVTRAQQICATEKWSVVEVLCV